MVHRGFKTLGFENTERLTHKTTRITELRSGEESRSAVYVSSELDNLDLLWASSLQGSPQYNTPKPPNIKLVKDASSIHVSL
jgi:hypothetical protein